MGLVTSTEMFKKAYEGGYAVGAFNVNNMEIIQGIVEAAAEEQAPLPFDFRQFTRRHLCQGPRWPLHSGQQGMATDRRQVRG